MDIQKRRLVYLHSMGISQKKLGEILQAEDIDDFFTQLSVPHLGKYFSVTQAQKIYENFQNLSTAHIDSVLETGIHIVSIDDPQYPTNLRQLANPPTILYVKGVLEKGPKFGVVGSRKITDYGKKIIDNFIPELSKYFDIVSGGAYGCDSYAHQKTVELKRKTVVILGTGIDIIHPTQNKKLYEEVLQNSGAIVSIFPIGTQGNLYTFPIRNEIISGLSDGVLIVEAASKSGSLITAKLALEQGKDVFSVPGDIFRTSSQGCIELLKNGEAKLVSCVQDIFEEYGICSSSESTQKQKIVFHDILEHEIFKICTIEPKNINQIAKELEKPIYEIGVKLSILELNGYIKQDSGGKYQVC